MAGGAASSWRRVGGLAGFESLGRFWSASVTTCTSLGERLCRGRRQRHALTRSISSRQAADPARRSSSPTVGTSRRCGGLGTDAGVLPEASKLMVTKFARVRPSRGSLVTAPLAGDRASPIQQHPVLKTSPQLRAPSGCAWRGK